MGECFQWKTHGHCSRKNSCSLIHDTQASGNKGSGHRRKGQSFSPASHSKAKQTDGEGHKSSQGWGRKQEEWNFVPIQISAHIRHVNSGTLPYIWIASPEKVVCMVTNAISDMLRQTLRYLKDSIQLSFAPQDFYPRKSVYVSSTWSFRIKTRRQSLQGHVTLLLILGKERVHRKGSSKSVRFKKRCPCTPKFREDHMRKPCTKKDAPVEKHGIWRNIFISSRIRTKLRFILLLKRR